MTMRPIDSPDTIAYGGHCEVDQAGRPIAAHFNWAPAQMPAARTEYMVKYLSRVAMHELTHALVFTPELISHFPPPSAPAHGASEGDGLGYGAGYYGAGIEYLPTGEGPRAHVATPRVARAVQRHFDCPTLRGAQLENGGGAGTAISHWEMRALRDEYMVGSSSPSVRTFSAITAALFADSGWYGVDESKVEPFHWGHHAGCSFVEGPCRDWKLPGYLCERNGEVACSFDRRSQAYCEIVSYEPRQIPTSLRPFGPSSTYGGYSPLLDFCPVYRSYANGDCTHKSRYFDWVPSGGQERCESCRCFESTTSATWHPAPSCFRMRCLNASALEVRVGDRWHRCEPGGGRILLSPYNDESSGAVVCPPASELCDLDAALWPVLSSIEPSFGPAAGGMPLTLRGEHLDTLRQPVQLIFSTSEGVETQALDLHTLNSTFATATVPALLGATSHARADVTLSDTSGRTAYLFGAFRYDPGWRPYYETMAIFGTLALLACYLLPAIVRAGCKRTVELREQRVWRTLDPRAIDGHATSSSQQKAASGAAGSAGASWRAAAQAGAEHAMV